MPNAPPAHELRSWRGELPVRSRRACLRLQQRPRGGIVPSQARPPLGKLLASAAAFSNPAKGRELLLDLFESVMQVRGFRCDEFRVDKIRGALYREGNDLRHEDPFPNRAEDPVLERPSRDQEGILTDDWAPPSVPTAAVPLGAVLGVEAAAADRAFQESGQHVPARAAVAASGKRTCEAAPVSLALVGTGVKPAPHLGLHSLMGFFRDDPEIRAIPANPLGLGANEAPPPSCFVVLDPLRAIEDALARVQGI